VTAIAVSLAAMECRATRLRSFLTIIDPGPAAGHVATHNVHIVALTISQSIGVIW
jgi:hypothetical protein